MVRKKGAFPLLLGLAVGLVLGLLLVAAAPGNGARKSREPTKQQQQQRRQQDEDTQRYAAMQADPSAPVNSMLESYSQEQRELDQMLVEHWKELGDILVEQGAPRFKKEVLPGIMSDLTVPLLPAVADCTGSVAFALSILIDKETNPVLTDLLTYELNISVHNHLLPQLKNSIPNALAPSVTATCENAVATNVFNQVTSMLSHSLTQTLTYSLAPVLHQMLTKTFVEDQFSDYYSCYYKVYHCLAIERKGEKCPIPPGCEKSLGRLPPKK